MDLNMDLQSIVVSGKHQTVVFSASFPFMIDINLFSTYITAFFLPLFQFRNYASSILPAWTKLTIYAPVIYTAPCIMFWMGAYTLRGEVGGGWALEFPSFLGPVKCERADRRVPFGAQKTREFQGPTPSHFPK